MIPGLVYEIIVRGEPAAQPRAKTRIITPRGGKPFAHVYTPANAKAWKSLVYLAAVGKRPPEPHDGPVRLDWKVWFPRTQDLLRASAPDGEIPHFVKPDRDNVEKAIMDALTEAKFWKDDSRVYAGEIGKYYVARGCEPGASIRITLEPDAWSARGRRAAKPAAAGKELFHAHA